MQTAWNGSKTNPPWAVHYFKPPALPEVADVRVPFCFRAWSVANKTVTTLEGETECLEHGLIDVIEIANLKHRNDGKDDYQKGGETAESKASSEAGRHSLSGPRRPRRRAGTAQESGGCGDERFENTSTASTD